MKKFSLILVGMVAGVILTVSLLLGAAASAQAKPGLALQAPMGTPTPLASDEGAAGLPSAPGEDEVAPRQPLAADLALPTPIPGESLVYFVPSDNDASATVLYLYNTAAVTHTVALRGFSYDGATVYAQNIEIPASSFRRLISDAVAAAPPPSWATPAPITTNFTDFAYFASLSLPEGVKVEGYTLFNPGTGTIDPRKDQGAVPLRFSTDPASMFLPAVLNAP